MVEVNADLPPPVRLAQAYDDGFVYDFLRKHMRGWLGASADALLALCAHHGYALVAYELGSTEHTQCKNGKCRRIGTCTHCETNMWFVRSDHLAALGVAPPSWARAAAAFWKQQFAYTTYAKNAKVFPAQQYRHSGELDAAAQAAPYTPNCYSLAHQYTAIKPREGFTKPACRSSPSVRRRAAAAAAPSAAGRRGRRCRWRRRGRRGRRCAWSKAMVASIRRPHASRPSRVRTS